MTMLVEARGLERVFGRQRAVDGVSFTLRAGEALGVFGPNGAGKTTLVRLLAGLLKPSRGEALVMGVRAAGNATARAAIGLISHESMLYPALTARENVELAARLYGVTNPPEAAMEALTRLRVEDRAGAPVRALSRGLRQRVSIARALVHDPHVILLDEPFTGLDEGGASALAESLRVVRSDGAAIVIVTHNITEGWSLASRVAVMIRGRFAREMVTTDAEPSAFASAYREMVTV